jgi:uncharacterized protein YgiM (DUF1202 family)
MARNSLALAVMLVVVMALVGCVATPEQLVAYEASINLGEDNPSADAATGELDSESDGVGVDGDEAPPSMMNVLVDRLNVRSGPGTDFGVVGKLFAGDRVELMAASEDGEWLQVLVDGLDEPAWIAAAFAEGVEPEPVEVAFAETERTAEFGTSEADEVQTDEADAEPELIIEPTPTPEPKAPEAVEAVETDETQTDEADVEPELIIEPTPTPEPKAPEAVEVVETDETQTDEADAESELIIEPTPTLESEADEAETAEAVESVETQIKRADAELIIEPTPIPESENAAPEATEVENTAVQDVEADVEADLIIEPTSTAEPTSTPEPTPEPAVPTAYTQPDRMNVRGGPGTQYPVVGTADQGTAYEIQALSPDGTWYQVIVDGAEEPGWIFANLAETAGPLEQLDRLSEDAVPSLPEPVVAAAAVPAQAAVVNAPPPAGGGFFGYGVQAHMLGGGIGPAIGATSAMGFNWVKQQVEWHRFEGSQGAIDFSELRRITDAAGANGISVLFSVVNAPEWARESGFDASVGGPPADPQTYAAFVGRLAGELCGTSLKAIEVWNEQNLHYEWGNKPLNPADYMNLLRPAYASIKAACPSMLVISGAPTPAGDAGALARDDFAYLEGMYQNGLARYSDGIGAHPSGYNVPPSVGWESACAVIQGTGNFFNGPRQISVLSVSPQVFTNRRRHLAAKPQGLAG